jgi:hypothetical protein
LKIKPPKKHLPRDIFNPKSQIRDTFDISHKSNRMDGKKTPSQRFEEVVSACGSGIHKHDEVTRLPMMYSCARHLRRIWQLEKANHM